MIDNLYCNIAHSPVQHIICNRDVFTNFLPCSHAINPSNETCLVTCAVSLTCATWLTVCTHSFSFNLPLNQDTSVYVGAFSFILYVSIDHPIYSHWQMSFFGSHVIMLTDIMCMNICVCMYVCMYVFTYVLAINLSILPLFAFSMFLPLDPMEWP